MCLNILFWIWAPWVSEVIWYHLFVIGIKTYLELFDMSPIYDFLKVTHRISRTEVNNSKSVKHTWETPPPPMGTVSGGALLFEQVLYGAYYALWIILLDELL